LTPDFEIVVVNDGSRDATHELSLRLAQELPLRYLALSRNYGKEAALSAGIDHARGNAVLLIDADFQHPLEMLAEMHGLWQAGYEMVYGVIADRGAESGAKRMGTQLFYRVMNSGSAVKMPPNAGDFRWMDRKVVDALKALPENNRFMKGLYAWVGFKTAPCPLSPGPCGRQLQLQSAPPGIAGAAGADLLHHPAPARLEHGGSRHFLLALAYGLWIAAEALFFGNPCAAGPRWPPASCCSRRAAAVHRHSGRVHRSHLRRGQAPPHLPGGP
jgi:hypothetical protein